jgi:enterochelin esterase-like enzyme
MRLLLSFLLYVSFMHTQSFTSFIDNLKATPVDQRAQKIEHYLHSQVSFPIIEHDSLVHFVYYGFADSVSVNGNLQHWIAPEPLTKIDCEHFPFFYRSYVVPPDARLDYQFIIDKKYQTDPLNNRTTPSGYGHHSEIRMPKFVQTSEWQVIDSIPHGTIENFRWNTFIPSPLNKYILPGRIVKVYLPHGYDSLSELPAVYVNDGDEMIEFAKLPTIIDNLIASGKIPPLIAVFIPPGNRQNEYLLKQRDRFVKAVCDKLVPAIDKKYKTSRSPLKRAMIGISNGAHISLYTLMSRPDVFYNAGGQSTTITTWLIELSKQRAGEGKLSLPLKLYFDCGRYDIKQTDSDFGFIDFLEMNRRYSALLSSLHVPHYFKEVNDGHEWASWRERMPGMLIYFFGK